MFFGGEAHSMIWRTQPETIIERENAATFWRNKQSDFVQKDAAKTLWRETAPCVSGGKHACLSNCTDEGENVAFCFFP